MTIDRKALKKSLRTNFSPGISAHMNRAKLRGRQALHLPGLLAGGRLDRPIFVIGAPRSGTSMLMYVISASDALARWLFESHEVWEADYHPALRDWESNVLTERDLDPQAATRIKRAFYLATGPRKRFIDKTPRNSLRVPFIDALWPDALYIHLQRDGRDNVNSLINAWRTPRYRTYKLPEPHEIPGVDPQWWKFVLHPNWRRDTSGPLEVVCAHQWVASNDFALDAFAGIEPQRRIAVRFEDLTTDPESEVRRVTNFIQVEYDDKLQRAAAAVRSTPINVVTPPEAGKWRHENPSEIEAIMTAIGPTMKRMGYDL